MDKPMGHWSMGLVASMKNPECQMISSKLAVVIKDKYPKALHHFLVLPWDDLPSIFHLNIKHIDLLKDLELLALNAIEVIGGNFDNFLIGYHAAPSMQRLHLHVLSKDFNSPHLKTKTHWNSFREPFFLHYKDVHERVVRENGLKRISSDITKQWLAAELKCHQCEYKPKNMPDLKSHLLTHL